MKKIINIVFPALCLLASACNKGVPEAEKSTGGDDSSGQTIVDGRMDLKVSIGARTKASGSGDYLSTEAKVNKLEVLAFSGGVIDNYGCDTTGATQMTLSCTAGKKEVWAFVNSPDSTLKHIPNKDSLLNYVSFLKNNSKTSFQMVGLNGDADLPRVTEIKVSVARIVSRIVIDTVTTDFRRTAPALNDLKIVLQEIYATNVVGNYILGNYVKTLEAQDTSKYIWYDKLGYHFTKDAEALTPQVDTLICEKNINFLLKDGQMDTKGHCLYVYPNASKDSTSTGDKDVWSPRHTRLVLKTVIDPDGANITEYYPITLPKLESNKSYRIKKLIITRRGSEYDAATNMYPEDTPVKPTDVKFYIEIKDWEESLLGNNGVVEI